MTCQEFDHLLHPYVDGEFEAPERAEAERHLAGCPACSRRVFEERQFQEAVRACRSASSDGADRAPDSLRRNVLQGIRTEHRRRQTRQVVGMTSAAAAVLVASSLAWSWWPKNRERYLLDAAQRHARSLPPEISEAAHEQVEAWFGGKLDHRVPVPRFHNADLAGARLSNVQERPAAYIRYRRPDARGTPRTIGLFVFGDSQNELEARPLHDAELETRLGYNVAIWRDGEIVYEMVTDLDEGDIRALLAAQSSPPSEQAPATAGSATTPPPSPLPVPSHAAPTAVGAPQIQPASLQR